MRALLEGTKADAGYPSRPRPKRIASERSDVDYLLRALGELCDLATETLGPPGSALAGDHPLLRPAIWTARIAQYRVLKNREERAKRKK